MNVLLVLVLAFGFSGQGKIPDLPDHCTGDPHGVYLYGQMCGVLKGAKSLSFDCEQSMFTIKKGKEAYRRTTPYKAWLKKPNFARLEVGGEESGYQGHLVGDGDYFWTYWPKGTYFFSAAYGGERGEKEYKVYMKKRTPVGRHSLGHEIGYIGASMSVIDLSAFHGYLDSLTPYLDEIHYKKSETVDGEECDVIHLSFMKGQRERTLWISKHDHLPRKLLSVVHVSYDILCEEKWTNVKLNTDLDPKLFQWTPGEDWEERQMPNPEDALLKKGDIAADFSLRDARGGKITLSDYKGKPVWLMFWRVG